MPAVGEVEVDVAIEQDAESKAAPQETASKLPMTSLTVLRSSDPPLSESRLRQLGKELAEAKTEVKAERKLKGKAVKAKTAVKAKAKSASRGSKKEDGNASDNELDPESDGVAGVILC